MLGIFSEVALVDNYDVYQHLCNFWENTMQDDVYAICYDGWVAGREIDIEYTTPKKGDPKEKGFEGRHIPKSLIIGEYFKVEQTDIEKLEAIRDEIIRNF